MKDAATNDAVCDRLQDRATGLQNRAKRPSPAWPGTPDAAKVNQKVGYPEKLWPGCVYIDVTKIASFPVNGSAGLGYGTDFYISRTDPVFKNNLQTEFLWSIPDNAK